jgi:hypothetical protein
MYLILESLKYLLVALELIHDLQPLARPLLDLQAVCSDTAAALYSAGKLILGLNTASKRRVHL